MWCLCRVLLFGLIILFLDIPEIYYVVKDDLGGFLLMLFGGINQRIHSPIYFNFLFLFMMLWIKPIDLELVTLLPPPPRCCDHSCKLSHPVCDCLCLFVFSGYLCPSGQRLNPEILFAQISLLQLTNRNFP